LAGACLVCLATYFSGTRDYPGSLPEATKPQPPARRSNSPRYVRQLLPCFLRNKQEGTHGRPPGAPARIAGCLASYRPAGQLLLAIFKSKGYAWRAVASYVVLATRRKQGGRLAGAAHVVGVLGWRRGWMSEARQKPLDCLLCSLASCRLLGVRGVAICLAS